jgi:hypothetical protein
MAECGVMKKATNEDKMYLRGFISGIDFAIVNASGNVKQDLSELRALRRAYTKKLREMY